jgi:hypothetical protein
LTRSLATPRSRPLARAAGRRRVWLWSRRTRHQLQGLDGGDRCVRMRRGSARSRRGARVERRSSTGGSCAPGLVCLLIPMAPRLGRTTASRSDNAGSRNRRDCSATDAITGPAFAGAAPTVSEESPGPPAVVAAEPPASPSSWHMDRWGLKTTPGVLQPAATVAGLIFVQRDPRLSSSASTVSIALTSCPPPAVPCAPMPDAVNGQVVVPAGGQVKVPTPRVG